MRPIRFIPWNEAPYDKLFLFQDENRLAVRLLKETTKEACKPTVEVLKKTTLDTTKVLASKHIDECEQMALDKIYEIQDKHYYILAECVFDKREPQWEKTWAPNANIIFALAMRGDKTLRCYEKGIATALTKWRSNYYMKEHGLIIPAQMFCRSPEDRVDVVCKSITAKDGCVLGNVDLSNATIMSPETVNKDRKNSKFLQLGYRLTAPSTVKPNEKFIIKVQALDGYGNPTTDVNYDGFVIEAVDGYVPHRRCELRNGKGEFDAIALGLDDGETMRVKFGRKYGTGLGECIVSIKS